METISEFTCPLCGHLHSIRNYEPENLSLDIEAVLKVGLGRGKGTKVVDRYSILGDDDVTPKVVKRVLALCRLFLDQNLISQSTLKNRLGIVDAPQPNTVSLSDYNKLREDTEALRSQAEYEEGRANNESIRGDNLLLRVDSLQVNVRELETQLSNSKSSRSSTLKELEELEAKTENSNEALDEVIEVIEERTSYVFDSSVDSREEFISYVIPRLLEDLEALKADDEE